VQRQLGDASIQLTVNTFDVLVEVAAELGEGDADGHRILLSGLPGLAFLPLPGSPRKGSRLLRSRPRSVKRGRRERRAALAEPRSGGRLQRTCLCPPITTLQLAGN
jgi:hypothetical protein